MRALTQLKIHLELEPMAEQAWAKMLFIWTTADLFYVLGLSHTIIMDAHYSL